MAHDDQPLDTQSARHWEGSIYEALRNLPGRIYKRIRVRYGAQSMGEVAGVFAARYPRIERDKLPKSTRELLGSLVDYADDIPPLEKYERSPAHDRDSYDKDGGYDRQGFSRS